MLVAINSVAVPSGAMMFLGKDGKPRKRILPEGGVGTKRTLIPYGNSPTTLHG